MVLLHVFQKKNAHARREKIENLELNMIGFLVLLITVADRTFLHSL